jgi:membrane-associated phospholipid phosphatase
MEHTDNSAQPTFDPDRGSAMRRITRRNLFFIAGLLLALIVGLLLANAVNGLSPSARAQSGIHLIEPKAGTWKTWVIASPSALRRPAPPDQAATVAEIKQLQGLASQRDAAGLEQVKFWDTGGPSYRWNEIAVNEALKNNLNANMALRALALVHVAAYDAIMAAWDSKYTYNRPRPSEFDRSLQTVLPNPASPSYPSEYATIAAANSAVLAYLFPDDAKLFDDKAQEAGRSRLLAGVEYPSDVQAGFELGKVVAAQVIARAKTDGSDAKWTGSVPSEPGHWNGTNPIMPTAGTWKTWVLTSGNEFRPGPPPAYNSPEEAADLNTLKAIQRTPKMISDAFFWEYAAGGTRNYSFWNDQATLRILAYGLAADPPMEARAYALDSIAQYDSMVACWDAKYTYWAIRPFQLDPTFKPLFNTPNHPSYPAAHGCLSSGAATTLAYLFPRDADALKALAQQAGDSRVWAGIHFPTDVKVGLALGQTVAQKVIELAQKDGSQ